MYKSNEFCMTFCRQCGKPVPIAQAIYASFDEWPLCSRDPKCGEVDRLLTDNTQDIATETLSEIAAEIEVTKN